ncbi:ribonuclease P protein component [Myxacorys almedinensis]|uniref:Ribonuclease P protein component n=1 Tax=Myxacorys almedinensis A TaxID=2690445 RepID=A0A8J8CMF7_9CYAN|nr:ribonuclease P protein component [Myxacorys almedinensis]NDJ18665.1 ribonuclease P protein component [Myxacorys almedinensis A]
MALPKPHRLKHRRDFDAVYRHGLRCSSRCFTVRALRLKGELAPSRIGISISKKVSKSAVVRNRIKRQIRAGLRQLLPRLAPGWDVVIGVRFQVIECDYFQFLQELEQLLTKAEVLYGD